MKSGVWSVESVRVEMGRVESRECSGEGSGEWS